MIDEVKVNYIDHISIAVKDLNKAVKEFEEIFGWKVAGRYADPDENLRVAYFQVGPTAFELMEDLDGTGEVAKFIERRGGRNHAGWIQCRRLCPFNRTA